MSEIAEKQDGIHRVIKNVAETLTVIGIGSYVIGFLIVNSYFLSFGYTAHSVFKTAYLSAGAYFLVFIAPIALAMYSLHFGYRQLQKGNPTRVRLAIQSLGIMVFSIHFLLLQTGTDELRNQIEEWNTHSWEPLVVLMGAMGSIVLLYLENTRHPWKLAQRIKQYQGIAIFTMFFTSLPFQYDIGVVFYLISLTVVIFALVGLAFQDEPLLARLKSWPPNVIQELTVVVIVFPLSVGLFGPMIYGKIKAPYGGGFPSRVSVVIEQRGMEQLKSGTGQENIATMLSEAQLLDTTDDRVVVLLKSRHGEKGLLMQVDKSLVKGLVYRP